MMIYLDAINRHVEQFLLPLAKVGACLEDIYSKFESILQYGCQYISLSVLEYRTVWWRIFHAPVST